MEYLAVLFRPPVIPPTQVGMKKIDKYSENDVVLNVQLENIVSTENNLL